MARFRSSLSRSALAARLGLFAASIAGALLVAELSVRALGLGVPPRGDPSTPGLLHGVPADEAPGMEFALTPNYVREVVYPGLDESTSRRIVYRINDHGFRGGPCSREKPEGTFRVAAIGDSFTFGTAVDQEETWPALVERILAQRFGEGRVEVHNWGVPAYNTRQEVSLLRHRVLDFDPDLVLLCAYVNDASGEERARAEPAREPADEPWEVRWLRRLGLSSGRWDDVESATPAQRRTMALRRVSRLGDLVAWKAFGFLLHRVTLRNYREDWRPGSPGFEMVKLALADAARLAGSRGFELRATMYPDPAALAGDPYELAEEHAGFRSLCEEVGIHFIDLLPVLEGRDARKLRAHAHDKHPSAECHAIVAKHLADEIARWIRRSSGGE